AKRIAFVLTRTAASGITAVGAGPDTCRQGYVWRDAFPGDRVCVSPAIRDQAAQDNRQANARRGPGGGPYGPDTCREGYEWRAARPDDHVCVTPQTRAQTASDNRQAAGSRGDAAAGNLTNDVEGWNQYGFAVSVKRS